MSTSGIAGDRIWIRQKGVARPDTRFHLNSAEVVPDFEGSETATERRVADPAFAATEFAFITPDNRLVDLRRRMIEAGKPLRDVHQRHPPRRPAARSRPRAAEGAALHAASVDGMAYFGTPVTLAEIARRGRFDDLVTGAPAASVNGLRFGMGARLLRSRSGACSPISASSTRTAASGGAPAGLLRHDREGIAANPEARAAVGTEDTRDIFDTTLLEKI